MPTLKKEMHNSVFLDGDWCWDADPFQVTQETKEMVIENITFLLNQYIKCTAYETIIFGWVMDHQAIIDSILEKLNLINCDLKVISLVADESSLRERLQNDIDNGKRQNDIIDRSIARLTNYDDIDSIKIDTSHKSVSEIVSEIENL